MKNVKLYITALAILMLFCGCDKGPELTPVTQEGKNTFSCKVNGKVWIPDGRGDIFVTAKPINGGFYSNPTNETINIEIRAYTEIKEKVEFFLRSMNRGTHDLNQKTKVSGASFYPENYGFYLSSTGKNFITSPNAMGYVNLTKADTISGIISGTFAFTAATSSGEMVEITDGRFDIKSPQ
jgi:hypothetical protein